MNKRKYRLNKGLTLVELMVAVFILLPLLTVVVHNFIVCLQMNEIARQTSIAVWGERSRIATIENTSFNSIYGTFDKVTFSITGLSGMGTTYVDNSNPDLLKVYVVYTWRDCTGRVNGEDTNLNGILDTGEDKNANGRLDSTVGFATLIYNK